MMSPTTLYQTEASTSAGEGTHKKFIANCTHCLSYILIFLEVENENDSRNFQSNGPSLGKKISPVMDERPSMTQQGNEINQDVWVKELDALSMMDQLAHELGKSSWYLVMIIIPLPGKSEKARIYEHFNYSQL